MRWMPVLPMALLACAALPAEPGTVVCALSDFRARIIQRADTVLLGPVFEGDFFLNLSTGVNPGIATASSPHGVTTTRSVGGEEVRGAPIMYGGVFRAIQTTTGDSVRFAFADSGGPTWMEWGAWRLTARDVTADWTLRDSTTLLALQVRFRCPA